MWSPRPDERISHRSSPQQATGNFQKDQRRDDVVRVVFRVLPVSTRYPTLVNPWKLALYATSIPEDFWPPFLIWMAGKGIGGGSRKSLAMTTAS